MRYVINIVSAMILKLQWHKKVPECFFRTSQESIEVMRELGYKIQVSPVRGLRGDEPNIELFESPWNAVWGWWQPLFNPILPEY